MEVILILLAAAALWFDMRKDVIPNRLLFPAAVIGVTARAAFSIGSEMPSDIFVMVLEVIVLLFCLWPVFAIGGLGAGDCKLLLMTGVYLPVKQSLFVVVSTFFIAAVESLLLILVFRMKKEKRRINAIHFALPFLLAVLFNSIIYI